MHRCCNGFGRSSTVKSYLPFNKLKAKLTDLSTARHALTVVHHRLLFEDFVKLKPGTEVTFLISRMNHFFQNNGTKELFQAELAANPLIPRVISGKRYFPFQAVVRANPKYDDFVDNKQ